MKKLLIILAIPLAASAQHRDTLTNKEIDTLKRNTFLIQQWLHGQHIDGLVRDKLDSVYQQTFNLIERKRKGGKR